MKLNPTNHIVVPPINWGQMLQQNIAIFNKYTPFHLLPWYYWIMVAVALFLLFWLWFDFNYYSMDKYVK